MAVMTWLNQTANQRVHATTKAVPQERWGQEKHHLLPIPPHYTTHYGERINISAVQPMMEQNTFALQHPLSTYEALLMGGDR